jgi:hypothetical protein
MSWRRAPAAVLILAFVSTPSAILPLASGGATRAGLSTTTTLIATPTTPQQGQLIKFAVTVSPSRSAGVVTGTVTIRVGSKPICTIKLTSASKNRGFCSSRQTPAGSQTVRAAYLGSPKYLPSASSSFLYVLRASTSS